MPAASLWASSAGILFLLAVLENLRIFQNCFFTGGAGAANGIGCRRILHPPCHFVFISGMSASERAEQPFHCAGFCRKRATDADCRTGLLVKMQNGLLQNGATSTALSQDQKLAQTKHPVCDMQTNAVAVAFKNWFAINSIKIKRKLEP